MKKSIYILGILSVLFACKKDEPTSGQLEPIAVLQPSTNPATTIKNQPIMYNVTFTTDHYIDSVSVYGQVDSMNTGYDPAKDSFIRKQVWVGNNRANIQENFSGTYFPLNFPPVGKKIHITFFMYSNNKITTKTVALVVT